MMEGDGGFGGFLGWVLSNLVCGVIVAACIVMAFKWRARPRGYTGARDRSDEVRGCGQETGHELPARGETFTTKVRYSSTNINTSHLGWGSGR